MIKLENRTFYKAHASQYNTVWIIEFHKTVMNQYVI